MRYSFFFSLSQNLSVGEFAGVVQTAQAAILQKPTVKLVNAAHAFAMSVLGFWFFF